MKPRKLHGEPQVGDLLSSAHSSLEPWVSRSHHAMNNSKADVRSRLSVHPYQQQMPMLDIQYLCMSLDNINGLSGAYSMKSYQLWLMGVSSLAAASLIVFWMGRAACKSYATCPHLASAWLQPQFDRAA